MNPLFLQNTSVDTIAVWKSNVPISILDGTLPIILSSGTGISNFFNIEPMEYATVHSSINGRTVPIMRNIRLRGTITLNAQSSALVALQGILEYQQNYGICVAGTCLIINSGALLANRYNDMIFTSPNPSSSRNRHLEDVTISFTCYPPSQLSVGSLFELTGIVNSL